MTRLGIITSLCVIVAAFPAQAGQRAKSSGGNLTPDMILTALQAAHVSTAPGSRMELIDRREGARGWHTYRLDKLIIRASGNHFVIGGEVTKLN